MTSVESAAFRWGAWAWLGPALGHRVSRYHSRIHKFAHSLTLFTTSTATVENFEEQPEHEAAGLGALASWRQQASGERARGAGRRPASHQVGVGLGARRTARGLALAPRLVVQLALGEAQLTSVQRADALRLLAHALLGEVARSVVALFKRKPIGERAEHICVCRQDRLVLFTWTSFHKNLRYNSFKNIRVSAFHRVWRGRHICCVSWTPLLLLLLAINSYIWIILQQRPFSIQQPI